MGSVRLKSKRAAFSISSAKQGGEKVKDVAAKRERDLRVEDEMEMNFWEIFGVGREIWGIWILGLDGREDWIGETRGLALEEAMITLAMADFRGFFSAFCYCCRYEWKWRRKDFSANKGLSHLILCHTKWWGCDLMDQGICVWRWDWTTCIGPSPEPNQSSTQEFFNRPFN